MILRVCLCIPTFDNPQTIAQVVSDALKGTRLPILVVDDGSEITVQSLLTSAGISLEPGSRVRVLRLEENQGKGIALQKGFQNCLDNGFTHMLAFDGDGQHLVSEISKVLECARENPWDLIVGNRKLQSATVPEISRFGRKFSNFWVQFQTGNQVGDSQSGFRLYPLFHLQNLKFHTRKYDFEIEVLIRLIWKGVRVRDVDIEVFYPDKAVRVSHFNKFWDNVRISLLNTLLVIVSLLQSHLSPAKLSLALGVGIFIGSTPFFGLHTLIVAAASFFFRLNAGILFLGSQVSLPFFVPFLVLGAISLGSRILNYGASVPLDLPNSSSIADWVAFGKTHLNAWFLGSFALGLCLGGGIGLLTYFALRWSGARKNRHANWNGRSRGGVVGNGFLKLVIQNLGLRAGYVCLAAIIPYFYLFAPRARGALNEYWQISQPQEGWLRRQRRVALHLFRFGQVLMDRVYQSFHQIPQFNARAHGIENIVGPVKSGKGLILLSAHIGGWDLAASLLEKKGFSDEIHTVEYKAQGFSFEQIKKRDQKELIRKVDTNRSAQPILQIRQLLESGKALGLMGDRPLGDRFELISFMGKLASFDVTPFRLAAATGTPLLLTFGFKASEKNYDFFATPSRRYSYTPGVDRELECQQWAQEYANEIALKVSEYPDQWFNFYKFWSAIPVSPLGSTTSKSRHYLREELELSTSAKSASAPAHATNAEG